MINGYCFKADASNPYIDCLKCKPGVSTTNWTLGTSTYVLAFQNTELVR